MLKSQTLYIENKDKRYEITLQPVVDNVFYDYDLYRFSEVLNPFTIDNDYMRLNSAPLKENGNIKVIFEELDWSDFEWGTDFVDIKGKMRI